MNVKRPVSKIKNKLKIVCAIFEPHKTTKVLYRNFEKYEIDSRSHFKFPSYS